MWNNDVKLTHFKGLREVIGGGMCPEKAFKYVKEFQEKDESIKEVTQSSGVEGLVTFVGNSDVFVISQY